MNVLYLDISTFLQNIMQRVVLQCGHTLLPATSLSLGRKLVAEKQIDLIIMGLEFPDGNAREFIHAMTKERKVPIPVIVMSSNNSVIIREELFSLGVFDFILKSDLKLERFSRYFSMLANTDELQRYMQSLKIAVLDDSKTFLSLVQTIFELNKLTGVRLFSDPEEFLTANESWDLYIIDYILPGVSGDSIIETIRTKNPEAIIICISGISNDGALSKVLMAGADDYMMKPFDANLFMARLKINVKSNLLNSKLKKAAITDGLTGAFNHAHSFFMLDQALQNAAKTNTELSVLMLDLDNFKKLNDSEGHQMGDEALVEISRTIQRIKRKTDILGRYGGEEFVLLLPDTGRVRALAVANKIRLAIATLNFSRPKLQVTVSIGMAVTVTGERSEQVIARADAKLYEAKNLGKNRVAV